MGKVKLIDPFLKNLLISPNLLLKPLPHLLVNNPNLLLDPIHLSGSPLGSTSSELAVSIWHDQMTKNKQGCCKCNIFQDGKAQCSEQLALLVINNFKMEFNGRGKVYMLGEIKLAP